MAHGELLYRVSGSDLREAQLTHFRIITKLATDSGLPNDSPVNVWHINAQTDPDGYEDFCNDLEIFYNDVDTFLSSTLATSGHTMTVYDMTDPEPRAPVFVNSFTIGATNTETLPPEMAVCVSFQGERISGTPQARRRGRIYLGPLGNIMQSATNPVVASTTVSAIATAAGDLLAASIASTSYNWCVFSVADDLLVNVAAGWVDNAFDVQRRRGIEATSRVTY